MSNLYQINFDIAKQEWLDLRGLVACVTERLSKSACSAISLLGRGSFNTVYKFAFDDDETCYAVSVPNHDEEDFVPAAKQSEIATMMFVRNSGLYPDIPVPRVHVWDLTFTNPAGAPYVVMDYIEGVHLNQLSKGGLDDMSPQDQMSVVKCLAKIQAYLSRAVPFEQIGSLVQTEDGSFAVGELVTLSGKRKGGPYTTLSQLWRTHLDREVVHALEEWSRLETDQLSRSMIEPLATPQEFSELLQRLAALIPHFIPPPPYSHPVLHHPDLALRNILFDSADRSKVVGILDWGGAQIIPLMLTARFPPDLHSSGDFPCSRPEFPDEKWHTVPYDWTCFGDTSTWPEVFGSKKELIDLTIPASVMIRRYYLRQYFGASYAEHIAEIHHDSDLARAMLFADASYYLKFHEAVTGSWEAWIEHAAWIRETYWRLRLLMPKPGALVVGPNTYRDSVEEVAYDLKLTL